MKKKLFTLALSLAVLTALPMTATAEGLGRLKIALELHGATDWQGSGGAWQKTKVDDTYSTDVLLKAGILQNTNTVDPNSWKEQQAHLAQVQAHTAKVQERAAAAQGQSGGMGPGAMDMSKMKELQQKVLACGNDEACKRQIAMDMMAQDSTRGPHADVKADIQAISELCIKERRQKPGSKGYQECMEAEGRKRSTRPADPRDEEEVAELPDRYLPYWSHIDDFHCTLKGHSKLQRSSEGAVPDVAGLIPVKSAESGEGDPDPKIICNYGTVIVDTKTNTLWVQQFVPVHVRATSTGTNGEQKTSSVSEPQGLYNTNGYVVKGSGESFSDWLTKSLAGAPLSGTKTQTFTANHTSGLITGGKGIGTLTAKLTWSLTKQ